MHQVRENGEFLEMTLNTTNLGESCWRLCSPQSAGVVMQDVLTQYYILTYVRSCKHHVPYGP